MSRLFFESDPDDAAAAEFGGSTDSLVAFLSFGFAARYGAQHDLTRLALLLRGDKIDLQPLLTFADRNVEDPADQRELDRVWQPAGQLAVTIDAVVEAIDADTDGRIAALIAGTPDLPERLRELGAMARAAANRDARVRLTFEL